MIDGNAAIDKIFDTVSTALRLATDKGGKFAIQADLFLSDLVTLIDGNKAPKTEAETALDRAQEKVEPAKKAAHQLVGAFYDAMWNAVGRPRVDVRMAILYPNAGSTGTTGAVALWPARLRALAARLETVPHPRVSAEDQAEMAVQIREAARVLAEALAAVTEAEGIRDEHRELSKALGKVGVFQLASLKRALQAMGFRPTEIHEVIPGVPSKKKKAAEEDPKPPGG